MRGLTVPHLVDLGDDARLVGRALAGRTDWDALRMRTSGPFALPSSPERWSRDADERPELEGRMQVAAAEARRLGGHSLASYGVGTALPELWLRRVAPDLSLTLTEFAIETVARLTTLLPDTRIVEHDLLRDAPVDADVHLFHRIDTEFSDRQWRQILRRFALADVLIVATDVLSASRMREEIRALPHRYRRGWQRAGWSRTAGAFERLWAPTHDSRPTHFGDLRGWVLTPRR